MNVLHLSGSKLWRGGENQLLSLIANLGPEVTNVAGVPAASPLMERLGKLCETVPISNRGTVDFRSILAVRKLLKSGKIDLIHAHTGGAHKVAVTANLGLGVPLVVSRRNAFPVSGSIYYRRVDRFIAVSDAARQRLTDSGIVPGIVRIIHDAVDAEGQGRAAAQRVGIPANRVLVLCVAAMSGEKDHATLLTAWRIVNRATSGAELVFAGDGPLFDHVKQTATGIDRITFLGHRSDVLDLIAGSDIVALSSREEGFGSSLCEAQWAGKPVVATRAGGIPEAVAENISGLLSPVGDAKALARNLMALIENLEKRTAMGATGAARARALFDPKTIGAQHRDIYAEMIEKRGKI